MEGGLAPHADLWARLPRAAAGEAYDAVDVLAAQGPLQAAPPHSQAHSTAAADDGSGRAVRPRTKLLEIINLLLKGELGCST